MAKIVKKPVAVPDHISPKWLWETLPWDIWVYFVGLIVAALGIGLTAGQTSLVRGWLGTIDPAPKTLEFYQTQIDRFTAAHNDRVLELEKGIISNESQSIGTWGYEHRPISERLRMDLKTENESYFKQLQQLESILTHAQSKN